MEPFFVLKGKIYVFFCVFRTGVLGWRHYGRGLGLSSATLAPVAPGASRPPLPPLASLRLSREPYATARQFA